MAKDNLVFLRSDATGWGVNIHHYGEFDLDLLHTVPAPTPDFEGSDAAYDEAFRWIEANGYEHYDNY